MDELTGSVSRLASVQSPRPVSVRWFPCAFFKLHSWFEGLQTKSYLVKHVSKLPILQKECIEFLIEFKS